MDLCNPSLRAIKWANLWTYWRPAWAIEVKAYRIWNASHTATMVDSIWQFRWYDHSNMYGYIGYESYGPGTWLSTGKNRTTNLLGALASGKSKSNSNYLGYWSSDNNYPVYTVKVRGFLQLHLLFFYRCSNFIFRNGLRPKERRNHEDDDIQAGRFSKWLLSSMMAHEQSWSTHGDLTGQHRKRRFEFLSNLISIDDLLNNDWLFKWAQCIY